MQFLYLNNKDYVRRYASEDALASIGRNFKSSNCNDDCNDSDSTISDFDEGKF